MATPSFTAKESCTQLCKLGDLPKHLQFNKDIWTGYRKTMSARACVKSWTYLHNESFNCYSHVIALLYFLWATRDYASVWPTKSSNTSSLVTAFILVDSTCSLLPFALSVVYHTFMPHSSGERTYTTLLKLDILGIWWCCTLGPISNFYTGLYCTTRLLVSYFSLYMVLSAYALYYLMVVDCKRKRVSALTIQFACRILIYPLRLSPLSHSSTASVTFYCVMDLVSATGAVVNALHIPERWFPGKLDYVFNGHTLMHVLSMVAIVIARQGFLCDMTWLNEVETCLGNVSSSAAVLGVTDIRNLLGTGSS